MSLLDYLKDENVWIGFYELKADLGYMRESDSKQFFRYVRQKRYQPMLDRLLGGHGFSIPTKKRIAKVGSSRKRVVYTLPEDEVMLLRLLTWLMIRKYDGVLSSNLYSFRPGRGVKAAMNMVLSHKDVDSFYTYKLDVSDYFNSIDISLLLPMIKEIFSDDPPLYDLFARQLSDDRVMEDGELVHETKGVMAGMPSAVFFANVYLSSLDRAFEHNNDVVYCRYSDDIILFARDKEALEASKDILHSHLHSFRLEINHDKEVETAPGDKWTFLGFSYQKGVIDVSDVSVQKLKAKMRRKSRSVIRWKHARGKEDWMAVRAFIKYFDRKLYHSDDPHEINWSRWYFPLINTDRSLKEIDAYMQDCIRYIATGKHTKARFNFRYDQMKALGMQTLVNRWYKHKSSITFAK